MEDCCHTRLYPILVDCMECLERGPEVYVNFVLLLSFMMGKIVDFYCNCRAEIVL